MTSNDRVKMTDFGFARITAPDAADKKSMTYCGTDVSGYSAANVRPPS